MASEDSEWAPEVAAFEAALGAVEGKLAPLLAANAETIKAQLSPLEHAKLELTLAYSMNSLYWMYLATQGQNPADHPVKSEMGRIKEYMQKIKRLEDESKTSTAKSQLDKQAAERFIKGHLGDQAEAAAANAGAVEKGQEAGGNEKSHKRKSGAGLASSQSGKKTGKSKKRKSRGK